MPSPIGPGHGPARTEIGDVGTGQVKESGGIGIRGHKIGGSDHSVGLLHVVQVSTRGSVIAQNPHRIHHRQHRTQARGQVCDALTQVGVESPPVLDQAHQILHSQAKTAQIVVLSDGHIDHNVGV